MLKLSPEVLAKKTGIPLFVTRGDRSTVNLAKYECSLGSLTLLLSFLFFCMLLLVPQEAIENKSGGLTQVKSAVRRSFCLSSCPARFGSRRQQGMPKGDESSPSSCLSYLCYLSRYCMLDIDTCSTSYRMRILRDDSISRL